MGVLNPLKVVIENYPEGKVEEFEAENNPEDPNSGTRKVPFSREIYIEKEDFLEEAPKKFYRLAPGREVRLKHAYYIKCEQVIKDEATGEVIELRCTYDPDTRGGWLNDGRKVKGTLHWVSVEHSIPAEIRLYDRLFLKENPEDTEEGKDFRSNLNPDSLKVLTSCRLEPGLANAEPGSIFQFLRIGYFCVDSKDSKEGKPVFNRTVTLRDSWAKLQKSGKQK
jgi:glutaminyl-tRNA synthetase